MKKMCFFVFFEIPFPISHHSNKVTIKKLKDFSIYAQLPPPLKPLPQPPKNNINTPWDEAETKKMLDILVLSGSTIMEAKQFIAIRRNAYNKAVRNYRNNAKTPSKAMV